MPVGNAAGDLVTSWLNPTSILIGVLAVATAAYLAAVYLAADAARSGDADLASAFRARALVAGVVAGGVALAGLLVVRSDARALCDGLDQRRRASPRSSSRRSRAWRPSLLVWRRPLRARARLRARVAVAAVVAGWALAQRPELLPG